MKNRLVILFVLFGAISSGALLFLSVTSRGHEHLITPRRTPFSYKDGLFYKKNSTELFTGFILDTADVIISFEVVDGKKHGAFITFYFNGNYEKYGLIDNDKNEGEWRYFYPDGTPESIGTFRSGKASGEWWFYYPDGTVKADGKYVDGLKHGAWMYYGPNGNWSRVQYYENGICRAVLTTV